MGQPHGQYDESLSTKQLLPYFNQKLGKNNFELLENLRFNIGEEENSVEFARELADNNGISYYVNESFATCHRKHASIVSLPSIVPSCAGLRLQKEVTILDKVKKEAKKPFIVIIGGAKLESKMPVIETLSKIADKVLLGSKLAQEWKGEIEGKVILPKEHTANRKDIDQKTIEEYKNLIKNANTILWAGPLGMYENPEFMRGTKEIGEAIAANKRVWSIIGGGDTVTALDSLGLINNFSFVSTGGGAMLEYLAKGTLPGIEVLE